MYQALYRKWRSRTFDAVVGQEHVTQTLKRQVQSGRLSHAYLFTGTRGTGKTSCAKLLARAVNCENPQDGNPCNACPSCRGIESGSILDVLELDAASNNRVDDMRAVMDEAVYTPSTVKKRVYIIDEVHMLSAQAFNALLQILEEPPEHLMFILATTEIHKVPATIKSRCQQFSFRRIRAEDIAAHLLRVAGEEGFPLTDGGAALIARLADGGMRDALSLLDQCSGGVSAVDEKRVYDCLGLAGNLETARLLMDAAKGDAAAALERLDTLYANGKEMTALAGEMSALVRDLLVRKTAPGAGGALMTGGYDGEILRRLSARFDVPRLVQMLNLLQRTGADLARSANRRTDMELCLVTLCDPTLDGSPAGLSARIARLEQGGAASPARPAPALSPETVSGPKAAAAERREAPPPEEVPWEEPPLRDEDAVPEPEIEPPPESEPVKESKAVSAPPFQEKKTRSVVQAQTADAKSVPVPEQPDPGLGGGWPGWPAFRERLKGVLAVSDYSLIGSDAMAQGRWDGRELTLWVANGFLKSMLDKPAFLRCVAEETQRATGVPARVSVKEGAAPTGDAPAGEAGGAPPVLDALDAFLAQAGDHIIVE